MSKKLVAAGLLVMSLLFVGMVQAQDTPSLEWWVIGSGGGSATVGNTTLDSTIGQWVAGSNTAGSTELGSGFWGGGDSGGSYTIYLPILFRDQ